MGYRFTEDHGRMLENIVYLQLKRQDKEIYFHKEKKECDFVIRNGYHITHAIQVTISLKNEKTKNREMEGLLEAMETYNLSEGLIITEEDEESQIYLEKNDKKYLIHILPCWQWLFNTE